MELNFEKFPLWEQSMELGEMVNELANNFPAKELYGLSSQIRKAADSIAVNVAKGTTCQTNEMAIQFLEQAKRSVAEVVTCLYKAKRRNYISEKEFTEYHNRFRHLLIDIENFKIDTN